MSLEPPTKIGCAPYYDPTRDVGSKYRWDPERAQAFERFTSTGVVHVKGSQAGQIIQWEPWQLDIMRTLLGWVDKRTGRRRYRRVYEELGRKNGKTTRLAALANFVLFCDGEPGAECYFCASDIDQASLLYGVAAGMIRGNPVLDAACKIRDSMKRVIYKTSFLRAIPADASGAHGFNVHLACNDELHAWPAERGRELYHVLQTGTGSRLQPIHYDISTAGYDRRSICWEVHQYAEEVRDGVIFDPQFLPVLYSAPQSEDWTDPEIWRLANPNLGVSVQEDYLRAECEKARRLPHYENAFRRLHLSQWTQQAVRWLQMHRWRSCLRGDSFGEQEPVTIGLDLSTKTDLTAMCKCSKRDNGYHCEWKFWLPAGRVHELEQREGVPYGLWAEQGFLSLTPGDTVDYHYIKRDVGAVCKERPVLCLVYDPWNAEFLRQAIEEEHGVVCVGMRQGVASLSAPSKELERAVIDEVLDHGGNPIAEWHAESCEVKVDDNNNYRPIRPDRTDHGKKIDAVVSAIMAIGGHLAIGEEQPSMYEEPGGLTL